MDRKCKNCDAIFTKTQPLQYLCTSKCAYEYAKKVKDKTTGGDKKINEAKKWIEYSKKKKIFLNKPENKICPVTGQRTTDIHHKKGRLGVLLMDDRYWLAVSRDGHRRIEDNPKWAKENGYSLNRL